MSAVVNQDTLVARLVTGLGAAIGAGLGAPVSVAAAPVDGGAGWHLRATVAGDLRGELEGWVDLDGAKAIARRFMNVGDEPEPASVRDMLREMWTQAAGAVATTSEFSAVTVTIGALEPAETLAGGAGWVLTLDDASQVRVAVSGQLTAGTEAGAVTGGDVSPADETNGNLAALMDIDLPIVVRFARTELSLKSLTTLGPGSMVDMGRSPDDPVQLLVGSHVIAEGEVVVVGGNYGIRITSLVTPTERLRAMHL